MKKLFFLLILTALFAVSCERKNKSVDNKETVEETKIMPQENNVEENSNIEKIYYAFDDNTGANWETPKRMFVTNINGLEERLSPSVDSELLGSFLYCEMVDVYDKGGEYVTIDGVSDYWYKIKCYHERVEYEELPGGLVIGSVISGTYSYVFGGYLSEKLQLPKDAPIEMTVLNGYWKGINTDTSYLFSGNTFVEWQDEEFYENRGTFSFEAIDELDIIICRYLRHKSNRVNSWKEYSRDLISKYSIRKFGTRLEISKEPITSDEYNSSEYYTFEIEEE